MIISSAIYAGVVIALGGFIFLSVESQILGSFLFSIGLLSVLVFNYSLFTGRVCYTNFYKSPLYLLYILVGNVLGASVIGWVTNPLILERAVEVSNLKLSRSLTETFIRSVLCGMFIAIGVRGFKSSGNVFIPIMAVMAFILTGSEHVIANAYYLSAAGMLRQSLIFVCVNALGNMVGGLALSETLPKPKPKQEEKVQAAPAISFEEREVEITSEVKE